MKSVLSGRPEGNAGWRWALAGTLAVLVAVVLPPFLPPPASAALMAGFHTVCHQLPSRSFFIDGVPLAVCHRCTGIYAGLVLGVLAMPLLRIDDVLVRRKLEGAVLLVALLPAAIDWGGDVLGVWTNTPWTRVASGLWFGSLAGALIARATLVSVHRSGPSSGGSPR